MLLWSRQSAAIVAIPLHNAVGSGSWCEGHSCGYEAAVTIVLGSNRDKHQKSDANWREHGNSVGMVRGMLNRDSDYVMTMIRMPIAVVQTRLTLDSHCCSRIKDED